MARNRFALIVEGQPFVGMVAADILTETGFATYHAFSAAEALAVLRSHPEIDVLVTEAKLTGRAEGIELSRTVSSERPDIRIVVTASGADERRALPAGARFLHKPYSSAELRAVVCAADQLEGA